MRAGSRKTYMCIYTLYLLYILDTIASIGRIQGQTLGIPPSESIRHLFQRLAIALWRENATLWIRRKPIRPATVDGLI